MKRVTHACTIFLNIGGDHHVAAEMNVGGAAFLLDDLRGFLRTGVIIDVDQEYSGAPCRASSVAVALPLPQPGPTDPAPVTIATFPFMLSTHRPPGQRREDGSQGRGRPEGAPNGSAEWERRMGAPNGSAEW